MSPYNFLCNLEFLTRVTQKVFKLFKTVNHASYAFSIFRIHGFIAPLESVSLMLMRQITPIERAFAWSTSQG